MPTVIPSTLFKKQVLTQAKKMVQSGKTEELFVDEFGKEYGEGFTIFIGNKPPQSLYQFDFPEDFSEGSGKKIFVGSK